MYLLFVCSEECGHFRTALEPPLDLSLVLIQRLWTDQVFFALHVLTDLDVLLLRCISTKKDSQHLVMWLKIHARYYLCIMLAAALFLSSVEERTSNFSDILECMQPAPCESRQ